MHHKVQSSYCSLARCPPDGQYGVPFTGSFLLFSWIAAGVHAWWHQSSCLVSDGRGLVLLAGSPVNGLARSFPGKRFCLDEDVIDVVVFFADNLFQALHRRISFSSR